MVNVIRGFLTSELMHAIFLTLCRAAEHYQILCVLYDLYFGPVAFITIKLLTYLLTMLNQRFRVPFHVPLQRKNKHGDILIFASLVLEIDILYKKLFSKQLISRKKEWYTSFKWFKWLFTVNC